MNTPIKYVAEIKDAREVTLLGKADLAFWDTWLQADDLRPVNSDGKARVFISAVASKFRGVRFSELSISIGIFMEDNPAQQDAVYLVQAFNSSRLFSFIERTLFHTPYCRQQVQVDSCLPTSFHVIQDQGVSLGAAMAPESNGSQREPIRSGQERWEGPIFLPGRKRGKSHQGQLFYARLHGDTQVYAFNPSTDVITLRPTQRFPVLQALVDSHFSGQEWILRRTATHARSKTMRRALGGGHRLQKK